MHSFSRTHNSLRFSISFPYRQTQFTPEKLMNINCRLIFQPQLSYLSTQNFHNSCRRSIVSTSSLSCVQFPSTIVDLTSIQTSSPLCSVCLTEWNLSSHSRSSEELSSMILNLKTTCDDIKCKVLLSYRIDEISSCFAHKNINLCARLAAFGWL